MTNSLWFCYFDYYYILYFTNLHLTQLNIKSYRELRVQADKHGCLCFKFDFELVKISRLCYHFDFVSCIKDSRNEDFYHHCF